MIRSPEHMPYGEVQGELNWSNFAKRQLRSNLMQVLATKSFFFFSGRWHYKCQLLYFLAWESVKHLHYGRTFAY